MGISRGYLKSNSASSSFSGSKAPDLINSSAIDNPSSPINDNTQNETQVINGKAYYVLKVNGGMVLYSKCGTNDIPIKLDSDFGTF